MSFVQVLSVCGGRGAERSRGCFARFVLGKGCCVVGCLGFVGCSAGGVLVVVVRFVVTDGASVLERSWLRWLHFLRPSTLAPKTGV